MEIKTQELIELSPSEIIAVTGGSDPVNNPPGIAANTAAAIENEPVNNPPGL
jgi:hypothetical protein